MDRTAVRAKGARGRGTRGALVVALAGSVVLLAWWVLRGSADEVVAAPAVEQATPRAVERSDDAAEASQRDLPVDPGAEEERRLDTRDLPDTAPESLGPLSAHGVQLWLNICDKEMREATQLLDESAGDSKISPASKALRQYEALKDLYFYKCVKELVAAGSYITFPLDQGAPSCPEGLASLQQGPLFLANGDLVQGVVWLDVSRRRALGDVYDMLASTRQSARWERIREWNNRPEAERRAEIDDYLTLSQKANGDATKNLTADEFVRYWRLHAVLLELDAEAIHGRTMNFERQGAAGR